MSASKLNEEEHDDIIILDQVNFTFERTWKDLIFLPFSRTIEIIFVLLILTTVHLNLFVLCFEPMLSDLFDIMLHGLDFAYGVHTALLICHRIMSKHRKRRYYKPHRWVFIVMDVVSILPLQDCYMFVQHFKWVPTYNETFARYATLLKLVRILRLIFKYMEYYIDPGLEKKTTILVFHFLMSSIITHIFVICYYKICCLGCGYDNISRYFHYITFDDLDDFQWFIILYTYVHLMMLHNYWGILRNATYLENILAILCLAIGMLLRYIIMLGNMIAIYICALRFMFQFKREAVWTNNLMRLLQFEQSLIDRVNEYYTIIWREYKGINEPSEIFKQFPRAAQREINSDIYWDAVMHSHLFSIADVAIRREICNVMQTEIRMPGEVIFLTGNIKAKMIYIVSGIIELKATENVGAPIMSFRTGTILGEMACIIPAISNGTFICSTTCHLHVLPFCRMYKVYRNYPQFYKETMATLKERIKYGKIKRAFLMNAGLDVNMSHVGWIKNQWFAIAACQNTTDERFDEELYNECYSSKFLDLLVLASGAESRRDIICVRDKCPLILKNDSGFRTFLDYVNLIVIALQFLITAKMIAFDRGVNRDFYPIILVLDLFYFLDLYIQLITMPKHFTSFKASDIMLHRSRQMLFLFDLAATVPYDYVAPFFKLSEAETACLRAPRFLKLYKLVLYFMQLEFNVQIGSLYVTTFAKFMVLHGIFIMLFVCFSYLYSCFDGNCEESWLYWSREMVNLVTGLEYDFDDYSDTFHHVISVYLGLKISNKTEINGPELVFISVVATVGFYVAMFCFIQLAAVVCLLQEFTHNFLLDMDILNEITDRKDLLHLKSKIINFADVQWNVNKNQTLKDIYTLMGQESHYLRKLVTQEYVMQAFRNTEMFNNADQRFLNQLAYNSTLLVIPEGHKIFDANYTIYYLYLIVEGNCLYRSLLPCDDDKKIEKVMNKFHCFPVVSVFHELPPLVEVKSLTTVILLCIPYLVIKQLLRAFPDEGLIMRRTLKIHREQNESIMIRTYLDEDPDHEMGVKVPTFIYSTEKSCKHISFYYGLSNMEKFFRNLVHSTYDPHSRAYICYELFRSFCIIVEVISNLLTAEVSVYHCMIGHCMIVSVIFWLLGTIDIYIRGHVQYYNELGIKVTKLSKTFKHYIETSFTIDFLSTFPYYSLGIVGIFYSNPMRAYLIMMVVMRSLGLYRPARLFVYIKNAVNPKYQIWYTVTGAIVIGLYFFATVTHVHLVFTCDTTQGEFRVYETSWINMYTSLENMKEKSLYLIIYYVVSSMTITHTYAMFSQMECIQQLLIVLYIYIMKMLFITYILGCESHGNIKSAKHQDAVRDYIGFTSRKLISNVDKNEMIEHIGNYWKKSNGQSPKLIFENFSPYMREEIFLSLYRSALEYNFFFHDLPENMYRLVVSNLDELYFKKDADIIRTNDVQDRIYIVASGHVAVYVANIYMCTLRTGGVFGCFNPRGKVRQSVRITASVHVKVVGMQAKTLFEIASIFPSMRARLHNQHVEMREYIKDMNFKRSPDDVSVSSNLSPITRHEWRERMGWFYTTFSEKNVMYRIWDYIMNVHIVAVSSTYCLYVLVVDEKIIHLWLWILLDIIFLGHIYIRSHTSYTNLESGVTVTMFEAIAMRYVKSLKFYVDMISILPAYLLSYILSFERSSLFLINKFIRVCNLYTYYHAYVVRKNVPRHMQWTFLIYNTLFLLQVVFDIWYTVADYDDDIKTVKSYLRVFSVYTSAGLVEREFNTENQLLVNLILIYVTQALLIYMMVVITRLLIDYNYTVAIFKISVKLLMIYFTNERVSKPLSEKAWTYINYLFRHHNGRQDPILFQTAPPYILQDHKSALYARIIESHHPFNKAHIDFMRQLYEFVEVCIYLPGDTIAEVGDCNSTMYFIEYGEVISIEQGYEKLKFDILEANVFGMHQGFTKRPHTKSYKAFTLCSVISVCKSSWEHLLQHFPATKEIIDEVIESTQERRSESLHFSENLSEDSGEIVFKLPSDSSYPEFSSVNEVRMA